MNTKRKVEDYIGEKVAIECSSEKEWELLLKLTSSERKNHFNTSSNKCFDLEKLGDFWSISSKEDIMENGWTIYPASDFLEEDKPFNVGDLVYLEKHYKHETESRDYSTHLNLNKPLTVKNIKLDTNAFGNKTPEWTVYFVEDSKKYGHPACKFKLWENTTPEYIEILHEDSTYTKKGRIYKVLSWKDKNCWVVCNVKCGNYEPGEQLCIDTYFENKSWWRPSTKEAYESQNEIKMLPYPTDKKYFKAVVTKDIHQKDISTKGSIPELIPKGYQTWFTLGTLWKERILSKENYVYPENNRWSANIPAEYFEIVEDKKPFKFEEGKWYKNSVDNFAKCKFVKDAINFEFEECISYGNYSIHKSYWLYHTDMTEADLSEIQQYLPEGHPDKFKIETPINKVENHTSFKVGDYITVIGAETNKSKFIGDVLKIAEILNEGEYGLWFKHFPESFSGGGFRYNVYKDKIRRSTPEEIKNSLILSQYPLTPEQCFKTKPLIKNRNPIVKETIKKRNRLEIKPIKQTIKLKHYV